MLPISGSQPRLRPRLSLCLKPKDVWLLKHTSQHCFFIKGGLIAMPFCCLLAGTHYLSLSLGDWYCQHRISFMMPLPLACQKHHPVLCVEPGS